MSEGIDTGVGAVRSRSAFMVHGIVHSSRCAPCAALSRAGESKQVRPSASAHWDPTRGGVCTSMRMSSQMCAARTVPGVISANSFHLYTVSPGRGIGGHHPVECRWIPAEPDRCAWMTPDSRVRRKDRGRRGKFSGLVGRKSSVRQRPPPGRAFACRHRSQRQRHRMVPGPGQAASSEI